MPSIASFFATITSYLTISINLFDEIAKLSNHRRILEQLENKHWFNSKKVYTCRPASLFKEQSKNMNERFLNRILLGLLPLCINMRSLNMIVLLVRLLSFYKCKTRSNDFFISYVIQGDSAVPIERITIQFSFSDRIFL